jgi:hypothetical protein
MVTFVSMFLWLMTGVHPVEVAVEGPVASVEIFIGGTKVGVAKPPAWTADCDFGAALRPHELVAVALTADGVEMGRARQVINLPRPDAEIEVVFEHGPTGEPVATEVVAQSKTLLEPDGFMVTFDGLVLSGENARYPLPDFDPQQVHILSAEVFFPGGVSARTDVSFGGPYSGQVVTELTAVAVVMEGRKRPGIADFEGVLRAGGEVLNVTAVERPGGRISLVRDHAAWPALRELGIKMERIAPWDRRAQVAATQDLTPEKNRFSLVVPNPKRRQELFIFPVIGPYHLSRFGLPWITSQMVSTEAVVQGQQLATAVAVAGVRAARDGCPRAVILALSENAVDASQYPPADVKEYLTSLQVPLVIWSTAGEIETPWGPAEDISTPKNLKKASENLMKQLFRQSIVWVAGHHLPSEIELDPNVQGFRLAY